MTDYIDIRNINTSLHSGTDGWKMKSLLGSRMIYEIWIINHPMEALENGLTTVPRLMRMRNADGK